jgi:hypothetical protein
MKEAVTMDEVTFEIETQAAATITNIGGDQAVYTGERRSRVARLISVAGLALWLTALGLLVLTGIRTANTLQADDSWPSNVSYYTGAVSDFWQPAVTLFAGGMVLSMIGRVLGRR